MKYYIPTSSLNFNNILSSESISPQSFYSRRGFGYSRWTDVEENNCGDVILLYDKPFEFERPNSDSEDHPMLVEFDTYEEFPHLGNGVYYSDHTIFLNPWDCYFIFFQEQHRTIALSLSDSSLETKMIGLYKNHIVVKNFPTGYDFQINQVPNIPGTKEAIEKDILLNKMKGLLYGYYIGALLSSSHEIIQRLRVLREIQNIFASVLSSDQRLLTQSQEDRLSNLFSLLNKQHPLFQKLAEIIGDGNKVKEVITVLKSFGHRFEEFDQSYLITMLTSQDVENNSAMKWVQSQIEKVESSAKAQKTYLLPEKEELITSDLSVVAINNSSISEKQQLIFKTWANEILSLPIYNGNISTFQAELSDQLTASVREIIGADWGDSEERTFLNHLRRHVRGESFTLPWDNGLFSSIAAVITKGDDWLQLLKFMQSKGMFDYRVAFAFYGVLNGFANLSRDFTDNLLSDTNKQYVAQVYKEIYGQLHGIDVIGANAKTPAKKNEESPKIVEDNRYQFVKPEPIDYPKAPKQPSEDVLAWQNMIREAAKRHIKTKKAVLLASLEEALKVNGENTDTFKFLTLLDNYNGWRPTSSGAPCSPWKNLQQELVPDFNERIGTNLFANKTEQQDKPSAGFLSKAKKIGKQILGINDEPNDSSSIEQMTSNGRKQLSTPTLFNILQDLSWIDECSTFIVDTKAKKQFIIDMDWFVRNYQQAYFDEKRNETKQGIYFSRSRENPHVIENLRNYMINKRQSNNPKTQWLVKLYQDIPIERIVNYLSSKYV